MPGMRAKKNDICIYISRCHLDALVCRLDAIYYFIHYYKSKNTYTFARGKILSEEVSQKITGLLQTAKKHGGLYVAAADKLVLKVPVFVLLY